ncbi:hypothetical protein HU200_052577 [Digitaria exilis]|uniref:Bifunctional inhibitor/plant lipid transfer protein/seed storage helical domain-containing protein n=1 Tax=Digitaria exilis TaxID=1010633 RepID=A0A835AR19_9POAL|nr:hypothetical protein HU200_052577 [Digitaria exilis]
MFIRSSYAAAATHLLLAGVLAISTTARAQVVLLPNCNFQEVDLVPCMAAGGGNISDVCCSSLNKALDAGHRCVCSLLLSNGVFASLVTNLLTLPLVLPLPGCFLYAPSLSACQAADKLAAYTSLCSCGEHGRRYWCGAPIAYRDRRRRHTTGKQACRSRAGQRWEDEGKHRRW